MNLWLELILLALYILAARLWWVGLQLIWHVAQQDNWGDLGLSLQGYKIFTAVVAAVWPITGLLFIIAMEREDFKNVDHSEGRTGNGL